MKRSDDNSKHYHTHEPWLEHRCIIELGLPPHEHKDFIKEDIKMDIKCDFQMNESGEVKAIPVPIRGKRAEMSVYKDSDFFDNGLEKELEKLTKKFKAKDWI